MVPKCGGVVAAHADFAKPTHQANCRPTHKIQSTRSSGVRIEITFKMEAGLHAAAKIFHPTNAKRAGRNTVFGHRSQRLTTLTDATNANVKVAKHRYRRLGHHAASGGQCSQSN